MTTYNKKVTIAAIGCGARGTTYLTLLSKLQDKFILTAAADIDPTKVAHVESLSNAPDFKSFYSANELFQKKKLADLLIIGTQDKHHFEHCKKALKKGYDILLEKPIAQNIQNIITLQELAKKLRRKVLVCFVLRYTPFYLKIKEIIDSGEIGRVTSINAIEGIEPWHMAHSFVRGHWAKKEEATPIIVAKSCHDTDIIHWLINARCEEVHSYGELSYFTTENKPADAPARCTDGCPVENQCMYNAKRYMTDKRDPWLRQVYSNSKQTKSEEILQWLMKSKWGRCVFQCDNDVVDSQTVHLKFENNVKATLTMTAFDEGRSIQVFGTKGTIKAGEFYKKIGRDIFITNHASGKTISIQTEHASSEYNHHIGGDEGMINSLYEFMNSKQNISGAFTHSHIIAFAAEESRLKNSPISIKDYYSKNIIE